MNSAANRSIGSTTGFHNHGRFQPGEGPSRGLLRDCTTSPINRFAALFTIQTPAPENFSQLELRCRASGSFHIAGYTVYRGATAASCRSMMDYYMTAGQIPIWLRSMVL